MKTENVMIILSELEISMPARIPPARYPAYQQGIGEVPTGINVVFMSSHYTQLINIEHFCRVKTGNIPLPIRNLKLYFI